jgi:hypothetical protein
MKYEMGRLGRARRRRMKEEMMMRRQRVKKGPRSRLEDKETRRIGSMPLHGAQERREKRRLTRDDQLQ